jgi:hypothetical protein
VPSFRAIPVRTRGGKKSRPGLFLARAGGPDRTAEPFAATYERTAAQLAAGVPLVPFAGPFQRQLEPVRLWSEATQLAARSPCPEDEEPLDEAGFATKAALALDELDRELKAHGPSWRALWAAGAAWRAYCDGHKAAMERAYLIGLTQTACGRRGGAKSLPLRRLKAKQSRAFYEAERQRLLDGGTTAHNVISKLATKRPPHLDKPLSSSAIRELLKKKSSS